MKRPSIAVVIPTYDRAEILVRAVESVLAQSRRPDEVIVVDDGSSDHTEEVVAGYAGDVSFVRKAHGGVSSLVVWMAFVLLTAVASLGVVRLLRATPLAAALGAGYAPLPLRRSSTAEGERAA